MLAAVLGRNGSGDRRRLHHPKECRLDGIVHAQTAERDAARFTVVEEATAAGIARNIVLRARVAHSQLSAAASAAEKASQQSVAVLWRTMVSACGSVVAHHNADRFRALPVHVALMAPGFSASHSARGLRRLLVARLRSNHSPQRRDVLP